MRRIWAPYLLLNLTGVLIIYALVDLGSAAAFLAGGSLLAVTFLLHAWVFGYFDSTGTKKLIAFALPLIVIKYLIFGATIYWVTSVQKWNPVYFCLGVGSFVLTLVLQPLWTKKPLQTDSRQ